MPVIKLKNIYTRVEVTDGLRILVDRLWPRGVRHTTANVDVWMKDIAPTKPLRKFYLRHPNKWVDFKRRYRHELAKNPLLEKILQITSTEGTVTLLFASRDQKKNGAVILKSVMEVRLRKSKDWMGGA